MKTTTSINVDLTDTDIRDILIKYLQSQHPMPGEWTLNISHSCGRGLDDEPVYTARATKALE